MSPGKVVLAILLAGGISIGTAIIGERFVDRTRTALDNRSHDGGRVNSLPDIRLADPSGREMASSAWAGKVLVLNYWASWCPSCVDQMPAMIRAQQALVDRGVQFVGIAVDRAADVKAFLVDHPVNYPILIGDLESVELSRRLGNRFLGMPFTAIFDARGRLVFSHAGGLSADEIKAQIDALVGPGAGAGGTGDQSRKGAS